MAYKEKNGTCQGERSSSCYIRDRKQGRGKKGVNWEALAEDLKCLMGRGNEGLIPKPRDRKSSCGPGVAQPLVWEVRRS